MKIQLDQKSLERMIGNDTEIEIEIRNSIANEFSRKYLKSLVNSQAMRDITNEIQRGLSYQNGFDVHNSTPNQYKEKIKEICNHFVVNEVLNHIKSADLMRLVNEKVELAAHQIFCQLQDDVLKNRIDKLVDKKIKEKLGL